MGRELPEATMKCVICKHGDLKPVVTSVLFEQDGCIIVIKGVPADICDNCGEAYVPDSVARNIIEQVNIAVNQGILVDVRNYSPEQTAICS